MEVAWDMGIRCQEYLQSVAERLQTTSVNTGMPRRAGLRFPSIFSSLFPSGLNVLLSFLRRSDGFGMHADHNNAGARLSGKSDHRSHIHQFQC